MSHTYSSHVLKHRTKPQWLQVDLKNELCSPASNQWQCLVWYASIICVHFLCIIFYHVAYRFQAWFIYGHIRQWACWWASHGALFWNSHRWVSLGASGTRQETPILKVLVKKPTLQIMVPMNLSIFLSENNKNLVNWLYELMNFLSRLKHNDFDFCTFGNSV